MNEQWAAKWVKALRSGEYKQDQNWLKTDNGFCCLGVLCDISNLGEWKNRSHYCHDIFNNTYETKSGLDYSRSTLTYAIMKATDIRSPIGAINLPEYSIGIDLTSLNDSGFTFSQIADIIWYFREEL